MDPSKTTYVTWSPIQTPQVLEAKTVNMKELMNNDSPLCDIKVSLHTAMASNPKHHLQLP